MRTTILLFTLCALFSSCQKTAQTKAGKSSNPKTVSGANLSPLTEGESFFTDQDFGQIVELKGQHKSVDQVFKVSEMEMILKDSLLLIKNLNNETMFMAFSMPDFRFIKSFGTRGSGPGEFIFPTLVKASGDQALCYVYENTQNKLYSLNKDLSLKDTRIAVSATKGYSGEMLMQSLSEKSFGYIGSIRNGKAMFQLDVHANDSISRKQLCDLTLSKDFKEWGSYIGNYGANPEKNRMVFAYKYFKRLVFVDTQTGKSRKIIFKEKGAQPGDNVAMLKETNTTHFWGISAQKESVYLLYSGRTPIDVYKEGKEDIHYIFVEQYDWNGNPIRKFRLDQWGYFCVNEAENKLILATTYDDQPFYVYDIPKK